MWQVFIATHQARYAFVHVCGPNIIISSLTPASYCASASSHTHWDSVCSSPFPCHVRCHAHNHHHVCAHDPGLASSLLDHHSTSRPHRQDYHSHHQSRHSNYPPRSRTPQIVWSYGICSTLYLISAPGLRCRLRLLPIVSGVSCLVLCWLCRGRLGAVARAGQVRLSVMRLYLQV